MIFKKKRKNRVGKILKNHVYHIPKGKGYGKIAGHDVVVVEHFDKTKWSKVKAISSLEKETRSGLKWDDKGLNKAKDGKMVPVPIKEIGTKHWSGIDSRTKFVRDSDLKKRHNTGKSKVKDKYLK